MYQILKERIDNATTLSELHKVWGRIKMHKLYENETLMAWYDLKYNVIGKI